MDRYDKKKDASVRTRSAIINMLKQHGSMDALSISSELSLSGMAIRQHLYSLQENGLVEFEEEARPMGRPAKLWRLTQEANKLFPSGYADLTLSLIESMKEAFGEDGLEKLLTVRNKKLLELYLDQMVDGADLRENLENLSRIRTSEGYMAEVQEQEDGSLLFVEKHCPICEAAAACTKLCRNEMDMFRAVLGNDVQIERVMHLLTGGTRCVYRVTPSASSR